MTKQTKKQICEGKATFAYYSGLGGLETKYIEYGIDDYMYLVSGVWHGKRSYHRLKIHYGAKSFRIYPFLTYHGSPVRAGRYYRQRS